MHNDSTPFLLQSTVVVLLQHILWNYTYQVSKFSSLCLKISDWKDGQNKLHTWVTNSRLLLRGKIRLLKVEHPKFEGHVTPNEEEYQKSLQFKFSFVLEYHNSPLVFWLHAYWRRKNYEISYFHNFWTSVTLTLDWVIQYTARYHSSTSTYIPNFIKIGKLSVDRQTLRPALLGRLGANMTVHHMWHLLQIKSWIDVACNLVVCFDNVLYLPHTRHKLQTPEHSYTLHMLV